MGETPPEVEQPQPRLPKGLKKLSREEVGEYEGLAVGLFTCSDLGRLLQEVGVQLEGIQGKAIVKASEERPEVRKAMVRIGDERKKASREFDEARIEAADEILRKYRLGDQREKLKGVSEAKPDIIENEQPPFEEKVADLDGYFARSLEEVSGLIEKAEERAAEARAARKAAGYGPEALAVLEQVKKLPGYNRAKGELGRLEDALTLLGQTEDKAKLYQAGLMAAVKRVIGQAGVADRPLKETVFQEAELLEAIQKASDEELSRLARRIDATVESKILDRDEGRFTAEVQGGQDRREQEIILFSQRVLSDLEREANKNDLPKEAVVRAADQIRVLVEKPGFLKKPLATEYLTKEGLEVYEETHRDELKDPIRKKIFGKVGRQSVEEALGCRVSVTEEKGERRLDFEEGERTDSGASIFRELAECEALDDEIRRVLERINPKERECVDSARAHCQALQVVDERRTALLKLADARMNGVLVAEGVRSGALKTKLAEAGVKTAEAAVVSAALIGLTQVVREEQFLQRAKDVLEAAGRAPDQIAQLWGQMSGQTFEQAKAALESIDLNAVQQGIQAQGAELVQQASAQLGGQGQQFVDSLKSLTSQAEQIQNLKILMDTAGTTANNYRTGAELVSYGGAAATILTAGLAITEYGRRKIALGVTTGGRAVSHVSRVGKRIFNSIRG